MPFKACQERHIIDLPLLGRVGAAEAFDFAHDTNYFKELIEGRHDPVWAYRYI